VGAVIEAVRVRGAENEQVSRAVVDGDSFKADVHQCVTCPAYQGGEKVERDAVQDAG